MADASRPIAHDDAVLDRLTDPLRHPEFVPGAVAGVTALAALAAARWHGRPRAWRSARARRPAPVAGLLLAAAALAGLAWTGRWSGALPLGLALLVCAPAVRRLAARGTGGGGLAGRLPAMLAACAALAGAAALTARLGPLASPGRLVATVAGAALAAALWDFDRRSAHAGLGPALVLVAAGGLYATVPDTEEARVLLAAALPLALLAWPWRVARLGPSGALLAAGLLVWVAATGGHGRAGSVVGGLAAAGLLLADPAARAVAGRSLLDRVPAGPVAGAVVLLAQAALALSAARAAGFRETAVEAALVAVPLLALAALALAAVPPRGVKPPTG